MYIIGLSKNKFMENSKTLNYIENVLKNIPSSWLNLTTHRLDIYNEKLAKTEFLEQFENLYRSNNSRTSALKELPTAYDYIRLGHPLSSILEWSLATLNEVNPNNVISFQSRTIPIFSILRKNLLSNKNTQILYTEELPEFFDAEILRNVYRYQFELKKIDNAEALPEFKGSRVFVSQKSEIGKENLHSEIDFYVNLYTELGSILIVNGDHNESYIADIQHVRRRETIAMTPANSLAALKLLINKSLLPREQNNQKEDKTRVKALINKITGTTTKAVVASSGLSMQYAIMMGLIHDALEQHKDADIKFIVPPNCYGGTNDQARRVAASHEKVEVVDLPVDGDNDMVTSIDRVLDKMAEENAVAYIIAEIPTNPRVEVPDLLNLKEVLTKKRTTSSGKTAIDPVFILDQTFCPDFHFLGEGEILSTMKAISYASGSKLPSGGKCTAGYCVGNKHTNDLMEKIEKHLLLCDNQATALQYEILAQQMPSMVERIKAAYRNTREFVNFIQANLQGAKINFVSEELADQGFTPSVFSLDLPTKGETSEEKESYKRALNLKLINLMISRIPEESKFCVSYGQLKGCYWTIPATSTQGTTKEGDKDYIVRVSLAPTVDLERHKKVFLEFVENHIKN